MQTLIKLLFIIFGSLFAYVRLLNIKPTYKQILLRIPFSLLCTIITYTVRIYAAPFTFIVSACLTIIFLYFIYLKSIRTTIIYTIMALVISHIFFLLSILIISPITYILYLHIKDIIIRDIITSITLGVFQIMFIFITFNIKRFKSGLPLLEKKASNDIGILISTLVLLIVSCFYIEEGSLTLFTILTFIFIFCGIILIVWWRSLITNSYLEKLNKRENERYEKTIETQQEEIDKLKLHNDALAKIIHKDNKLIPAMELAVKEFLCNASLDNSELTTTANSLIKQLEALASERKGIINRYELSSKTLTKTGVGSTDAVMKYLLHRANEANILFDLTVTGNIRYLISSIISENDLNTLISDLGENALIAAKEAGKGSVFITLGIDGEDYCLSIYDNGPYFNADVIKNLGKSRYTTHILTGGSGIGLMTTFELLRKYNASFEIDENIVHEVFKKCVSVRFDSCSRLRIKSSREEIAKIFDMSYSLTDTYEPGCFEANINGSIQKL